ncbi:NAD(+) diphosphatase [Leucobacter sp. CSA1]|uniref:NAD(+) diphosphatase n=1 Tax=Leucobacter chromiisoli TaxID=2796471 RepID=A0A934Q9S1_9MICO|nr:NAD(+) diphosphatase [Leucobacter chromiisoli]MBK0419244.1 NAD(+) diphosphatase [Leucobacter chromiisoli]
MGTPMPPLASGQLDRDAAARASAEALAAAWDEAGARVLRVNGVLVPVREREDGAALALAPVEGRYTPVIEGNGAGHCYLGRMSGAPVFAVAEDRHGALAAGDPGANGSGSPSAAGDGEEVAGIPGAVWRHPFAVGMRLDDTEREILTVASGLLRWHEAAGFSPRDGRPTTPMLGGWGRRDEHGGEHFPRTDPAVIVLVEHDGRVLLGSNVLWETGRFSLLAGFVEAGESAEQTVLREVYEEAGVPLEAVEYVTSQPWPFPRSLMLGFRARLAEGADPDDLSPDPEEISELRWFSREELRDPAPGITLPMPVSIARWMIDRWVDEGESGAAVR